MPRDWGLMSLPPRADGKNESINAARGDHRLRCGRPLPGKSCADRPGMHTKVCSPCSEPAAQTLISFSHTLLSHICNITHRLELAFVCEPINASAVREDPSLPPEVALDDLADFQSKGADLIVEVAHPSISSRYGAEFLQHADYLAASVTAFADSETEAALRKAASGPAQNGLYIPSGALWGKLTVVLYCTVQIGSVHQCTVHHYAKCCALQTVPHLTTALHFTALYCITSLHCTVRAQRPGPTKAQQPQDILY